MAIFISSSPALKSPLEDVSPVLPLQTVLPSRKSAKTTKSSKSTDLLFQDLRKTSEHTKSREYSKPKIFRFRILMAVLFLIVLLAANLISAYFNLEALSATLLHSFELLFGIFLGLIGGELAALKTS
jgi:hypothetical protein